MEHDLLVVPRHVLVYLRNQPPPPRHLLQVRRHLEDQHFLQTAADVHHQLGQLVVVRDPVVLVVQDLVGQHPRYPLLVELVAGLFPQREVPVGRVGLVKDDPARCAAQLQQSVLGVVEDFADLAQRNFACDLGLGNPGVRRPCDPKRPLVVQALVEALEDAAVPELRVQLEPVRQLPPSHSFFLLDQIFVELLEQLIGHHEKPLLSVLFFLLLVGNHPVLLIFLLYLLFFLHSQVAEDLGRGGPDVVAQIADDLLHVLLGFYYHGTAYRGCRL